MIGSRFARLCSVTVLVAVLLTACGGGGGPAAGGKVGAQEWVRSACTSIGTWVKDVQARISQVSSQKPSTAEAGKKVITDFFDAVIADTQKLIDQLGAAGTPDVENGDQIEGAIVATLGKAKSLLEQARTRVANLSTDNPRAFVKAVQAMSTSVQQAFQKAGQQFSRLRSPELQAASAKEPACKSIGAA